MCTNKFMKFWAHSRCCVWCIYLYDQTWLFPESAILSTIRQREHRRLWAQWNSSAYYCNHEYVILHLSKPTRCTTPRYKIWMIIMCQCRVINCNKYTIRGRMLAVQEAVSEWGQGLYENSLHLLYFFLLWS